MDCLACLTEAIRTGRPVALGTIIEAPGQPDLVGSRCVVAEEGVLATECERSTLTRVALDALAAGRTGTVKVEGLRIYVEPFFPRSELVVVGGGHVAQPLAEVGRLLGYHVTVVDDRAEYASRVRFPTADRVICERFVPALRSFGLGPRHHLVLVTRGHHHDLECLREVISLPLAYIGMIGSRARVETVYRLLAEEHGVDPALLERVHAPVGLDVGARTPAEIAVAVGAELVKVRNGGTGESLSRLGRPRIHGGDGGV